MSDIGHKIVQALDDLTDPLAIEVRPGVTIGDAIAFTIGMVDKVASGMVERGVSPDVAQALAGASLLDALDEHR